MPQSKYALKCPYEIFGNRGGSQGMKHTSLCKTATQNYKKKFLTCNLSNVCITLDRGKLFYCSIPAYIRFFNEKMKENYSWENECIDIYTNDKETILDFLRQPHTFCGYCDLEHRKTNRYEWEVSKKDRTEWEIT
jgi:hypothetical protein